MHKIDKEDNSQKSLFVKPWLQWLIVGLILFLFSWLYMGRAITDCSTTSIAFNSDSTGGFGWLQWVGGNDLSWPSFTIKSNYPYGESLNKPQNITSAVFIILYKIVASISTPICGLNLMVLLGYMSTGLLMFGLVKWQLKRFDIALFAAYAAAFVPYHHLKAENHVVYVWSSVFIAIIWAYLYFLNNPTYKKAALFSVVSATGFYFDGYYILITALLLGALYSSSFLIDTCNILLRRNHFKEIFKLALVRLRYLMFSGALLIILLIPIFYIQKAHSAEIKQSLASARSDIRRETITYGARPIEYVLPSFDNPIMPQGYANWRLNPKKEHYSNPSETTLYASYTILLLTLMALILLTFKKYRRTKFRNLNFSMLVFTAIWAVFILFIFSLPAKAYINGHDYKTPVYYLVHITSNWRVLARTFLAIDPLLVLLACFGLWAITKNLRRTTQAAIVLFCVLILFIEYLPAPLSAPKDLYKDSPTTYKQISNDKNVNTIAEYPLIDFNTAPTAFTYQQLHNKNLINATDAQITKGPLDGAIAGLNDPQTLGVLKNYGVDVIVLHDKKAISNKNLDNYYQQKEDIHLFSYRIRNSVIPKNYMLIADKGFDFASVDKLNISHRSLLGDGTVKVVSTIPNAPINKNNISISFDAGSKCSTNATMNITQAGKSLWHGKLLREQNYFYLNIAATQPVRLQSNCRIDISRMNIQE
jgi:hypothetical protein